MKERKKYQLAKLAIDGEEGDYVFILDEHNYGKTKFQVLDLKRVEEVLNSNYEELLQYKELKKREQSLISRISNLRNENEELKKHQSDGEQIKQVCKIIQERISFIEHEPSAYAVVGHLQRIKEKLQRENLWRE